MNKKTGINLTFRYTIHQIIFFAAECGALTFAAAFLLKNGLTADKVGLVLFGASFLTFLAQPIAADIADRAEKNIIPLLIMSLSIISAACFAVIRFIKLPTPAFAAIYLLGMLAFDTQSPLMNSISVYYSERSWSINFGIARGLGSVGFALSSLMLGELMEVKIDWVMPVLIGFILLNGLMALVYPQDNSKPERKTGEDETGAGASGLFEFFKKYKWYTISLIGVLLLGMIHLMTENYMIELMKLHGGDSSNVGVTFFLSTMAEIPGIFFFSKINKRFGTQKIFVFCGLAYTFKMLMYIVAGSVYAVYAATLLQFCTYALFCPVQVYYAKECISNEDMVKGQSTIYAAYSLGGAFGNLLGGFVIAESGVRSMLYLAVALSALGVGVLLYSVPKARKNK